jgi:hypothetical protein
METDAGEVLMTAPSWNSDPGAINNDPSTAPNAPGSTKLLPRSPKGVSKLVIAGLALAPFALTLAVTLAIGYAMGNVPLTGSWWGDAGLWTGASTFFFGLSYTFMFIPLDEANGANGSDSCR